LNFTSDNRVNIEDLTFRQFALVYRAIKEDSEQGGYAIDIDELKLVMEGFKDIDIKTIFDLDKEKEEIETRIKEIMNEYKNKELNNS
jgi:hypothetical protein